MTSMLNLLIIAGTDALFILLGLYCIFRMIQGYKSGGDLLKYQGYLIGGMVLIFILPPVFTNIVLYLVPDDDSVVQFTVPVLDRRSDHGYVKYEFTRDNEYMLNVVNDYGHREEFIIDAVCNGPCSIEDLDPIRGLGQITIDPKVWFQLPVKIRIHDHAPAGDFNITVTVRRSSGEAYDQLIIPVNIPEAFI